MDWKLFRHSDHAHLASVGKGLKTPPFFSQAGGVLTLAMIRNLLGINNSQEAYLTVEIYHSQLPEEPTERDASVQETTTHLVAENKDAFLGILRRQWEVNPW